jgi:hypothetical protein
MIYLVPIDKIVAGLISYMFYIKELQYIEYLELQANALIMLFTTVTEDLFRIQKTTPTLNFLSLSLRPRWPAVLVQNLLGGLRTNDSPF